jgi:hypothetical protein
MFAPRFFGRRFFAGRYWSPAGTITGGGSTYPRRIIVIN